MKSPFLRAITLLTLFSGLTVTCFSAKPPQSGVKNVSLKGFVGQKIHDCVEHRVLTQDIQEITAPFYLQNETQKRWQTEFWGKWVQGAMSCYRYSPDPKLYNLIQSSVEQILKAQLPDGYIGNYDTKHQLSGWDVWGRKYTTLGLLKWYNLSADKRALKAACKLIDYTIAQIGPNGTPVHLTGIYKGMASASILEPVMLLYKQTGEKKYLDFAQHIVSDWEKDGGAQLIAKADIPVGQRFPVDADHWWTSENGQKAYEMMSCYVGLLELYKVTRTPLYLQTVEKVVRHIMDEEINVCGSGAAFECWYDGAKRQTRPTYHSMETCVTFTWMQLNERLLQITDNPLYADNIELTVYNALMASMKGDASQIAKYTPLEGVRHPGEEQCGLHINCCNANGPRAFAMIPRFAYMTRGADSIDVNFFAPSQANIQLGRNTVELQMQTDYPASGNIELTVNPEKETTFNLSLRIPAWSDHTTLAVNGEQIPAIKTGSYLTLNRAWKKGDKVSLQLAMSTRLCLLNDQQALKRGPIILARDSRFSDGPVDETCIIQQQKGIVQVQSEKAPTGIWMAFAVKAVTGTDLEGSPEPRTIHFCDFASAGNTWDNNQRYRVWLPLTLNARNEPR